MTTVITLSPLENPSLRAWSLSLGCVVIPLGLLFLSSPMSRGFPNISVLLQGASFTKVLLQSIAVCCIDVNMAARRFEFEAPIVVCSHNLEWAIPFGV